MERSATATTARIEQKTVLKILICLAPDHCYHPCTEWIRGPSDCRRYRTLRQRCLGFARLDDRGRSGTSPRTSGPVDHGNSEVEEARSLATRFVARRFRLLASGATPPARTHPSIAYTSATANSSTLSTWPTTVSSLRDASAGGPASAPTIGHRRYEDQVSADETRQTDLHRRLTPP